MKRVFCAVIVLLFILALCLPVGAESDYSVLPEEYVALENYLPNTLLQILPDDLFSRDVTDVQAALSRITSFAGILSLVLDMAHMHLKEHGALLASICALLLLCGILQAFGHAQGVAGAGIAPRICLFVAVVGAGYAAVTGMVAYFSALKTLMNGMLPMMHVMYLLGGNVSRATVGNAMLSVGLGVCESVCAGIAPPLFGACMAMTLPGVLESGVDLSRLSAFLKKSYTTVMGVLTLILTLCLSAQNLLASRADSLAMRSGRYAIGQMIPIVGGALAGTLDTLAAGVGVLRGVAGTCGVMLLLLGCLPILARMLILRTIFDLSASVAHTMGCAPESAVLGEASSLFGYMAAAVAMCTAVFIISVGAFATCAAAWMT